MSLSKVSEKQAFSGRLASCATESHISYCEVPKESPPMSPQSQRYGFPWPGRAWRGGSRVGYLTLREIVSTIIFSMCQDILTTGKHGVSELRKSQKVKQG